jgi:hypothetical protein
MYGYLIGLFLGGVAVVGFIYAEFERANQMVIVLVGITIILWCLVALIFRGRLSYWVRSLSAIIAIYVMAVVKLIELGPDSTSSTEFVCACVFAAFLFGKKGAFIALAVLVITLGLFIGLVTFDLISMDAIHISNERFVVWSLLTAMWATVTSFGAALMLQGLDHAVQQEKNLRDSLENTVVQRTQLLSETNRKLGQENAKRKQTEREKAEKIEQLKQALNEVKTLRGILPICASCKKIRDDEGYWNQIEGYIQKHSDAQFSHGVCPECVKKLYPDLDLEV